MRIERSMQTQLSGSAMNWNRIFCFDCFLLCYCTQLHEYNGLPQYFLSLNHYIQIVTNAKTSYKFSLYNPDAGTKGSWATCKTGRSLSTVNPRKLWPQNVILTLWPSGLICFLSQSTCWALLTDDLGSNPGRSVSFQLVDATRLISRTGTEGPPVSSLSCFRCRLWSYDLTAGYKCEYYYNQFFLSMKALICKVSLKSTSFKTFVLTN